MSVPLRMVELEDVETMAASSASLADIESEVSGRREGEVARIEPAYPQLRVSNVGRSITIDRNGGDDRFVFSHAGRKVAELFPQRDAVEGLTEWRLTFQSRTGAILASDRGVPPIGPALFFVDVALDKGGLDEAHDD